MATDRLLLFLRAFFLITAGAATLVPDAFGRLFATAVVVVVADSFIRGGNLAPRMQLAGTSPVISPLLVHEVSPGS